MTGTIIRQMHCLSLAAAALLAAIHSGNPQATAQTPPAAEELPFPGMLLQMDAITRAVNRQVVPEAGLPLGGDLSSEALPAGETLDSALGGETLTLDGLKPYCCDTCGDPCTTTKSCGCTCCCSCSCLCPLEEAPCLECNHVSTLGPYYNIHIFGNLKLDMLFNSARPVAPGVPFFLSPGPTADFNQETVSIHGRQTTLAAALTGPQMGSFQSGGLLMAMLFDGSIVADRYGFLPLQAYGELKNEDWRFAAGLQFDVFSPGLPTVLPFSALAGAGNSGNAWRGQVRVERFIHVSPRAQWTLQGALSDPITTTIDPTFGTLSEDNGWPNLEGRIALGLGCMEGTGLEARRPFEIGLSGVVGQIRTTVPLVEQEVADVWGLGFDYRWKVNDRWGFAGEFYTGETLGTYNGGVLQNINRDTLEGVRTSGGWFEYFYYWTPCMHSHLGYAADNPSDSDIADSPEALGRTKNSILFANLLWDVNSSLRIGFELARYNTDYKTLNDNEGTGFHMQFQWAF